MRRVVVLAPMPLEMDAITTAFGLSPTSDAKGAPWTGRVGESEVTAIHIGMGPPLTRAAVNRVLDEGGADHIMNAGICGGLDPDLPVGTLINPEVLVLQSTGARYLHKPPGDVPLSGMLSTAEEVTFDVGLSKRLFAEGFIAVDMESAAVAEVCEARGCPWSVYRCIGDRYFDGLLDPRLVAMTNQDGSGNRAEIERLLAAEPDLMAKLEQLSKDTTNAARLAAEAAVRGCLALDD
jgi:adenosylhomocysteine nucleosidase